MATMNVSLPEQMKAWVEHQSEGGRFANSSGYVRDLIRRDQERGVVIAELQAGKDAAPARGARMRLAVASGTRPRSNQGRLSLREITNILHPYVCACFHAN